MGKGTREASLLLFLAFWTIFARAQSGLVLSQEREGSASVYVSVTEHRAYILDGGKTGGLTRPRMGGKSVLKWLLDGGYRHLVISCSHPHDDHSAGLLEIIRSDPDIEKFESIHFVDSGYPVRKSLIVFFKESHPNYSAERVSYASALGENGFAKITPLDGEVTVQNFIYTPEVRDSIHGHAMITQITLRKNGARTLIVDFDDADSKLVEKWVDWAEADPATRRPNVVIAPHHCSDLTEVEPLLRLSVRPDSCVITANSDNRYLHPGPIMFQKWIDGLGVRNVHVTGVSGNILITHDGLPPINDYNVLARNYFEIVRPNLSEYKKALEKAHAADIGSNKSTDYLSHLDQQCKAFAEVEGKYVETLRQMVQEARIQQELAAAAQMQASMPENPAAIDFDRETSHNCAYCGQKAVGWCHMRNKWVCEEHKVFMQDGAIWRCPP